jgi:hypothetical protein
VRRSVLLVLLVAAALAGGCVGPSRTDHDYRQKAANAAETARSAVETARLVVRSSAEGKAPARYVSLVLSEQEDVLSSVARSFEVVQPPSAEAASLRELVATVLEACATTVAELRIAARAGGLERLPPLAEPLPALSSALADLMGLADT